MRLLVSKKDCSTIEKTKIQEAKLIQSPRKLTAEGYQRRYMKLTNTKNKNKSV